MDKAIVVNTPDGIEYFRLASVRGMVNLESKGLKASRGVNVTAMMRREFGLKPRAPHSEVIAAIEKRMDELMARRKAG